MKTGFDLNMRGRYIGQGRMIRDHLKVHVLIDHGGKNYSPTNTPALEPDPVPGPRVAKLKKCTPECTAKQKSLVKPVDLQGVKQNSCGLDGTRTRDLRRDRAAF